MDIGLACSYAAHRRALLPLEVTLNAAQRDLMANSRFYPVRGNMALEGSSVG